MALVGQIEGSKYDLGFLDASGNLIGLTLVRDKNGVPRYEEVNDPALASQYFTGQAQYTNLQPQKEIQIGQSGWRSGFGQEYFDLNDAERYYTSKNTDARFKGMIIAGPKATAVTLPTAILATIDNGDMELDSDWTTETGTAARSSTQKHGGTYSWRLSGAAGGTTVYQELTWDAAYRGQYYGVVGWIWQTVANTGCIGIDDGVTAITWSTVSATISSWVRVSVRQLIASNATRIRIYFRNTNTTATNYVYFDDILQAVAGNPVSFCEFNDQLYMAEGNILTKLNTTTGASFDYVYHVPYTITDLEVLTNTTTTQYLFISQGATDLFWYMTTAEAFTYTDSAAHYFQRVGNVNYKARLANLLYSATTNPLTDAGWSTPATYIGDITDNITSLAEIQGTLYIGKEDMPYYLDSASVPQRLIPSLRSEKASTSCKNMIEWKGNLYIPCGAQSLYEYDVSPATVTDISPSKYITNSTDFDGQVMALASDAQWLYAILDNDDKVELLAGRWETIDSTTTWVWHPIAQLTLTGCETAFASTVYKRRLYVASTSSGDSLYYFPLTSMYGNITADTDYIFQTDGEIITPWHHCEFRADKKAFYKITLTMSGTTANIYYEAHYQKLGDGSTWTDIGDFKTSPTTSANLPLDASSNKPQSTMVRFKFVPKTNTTASTPILLNYDVRAIWYPPHKKFALAQVIVADHLKLKDGLTDEEQSAATIRTALNAWDNPTTAWPRAFYPPYWESATDTVYAKLMPAQGAPFCIPVKSEKNGNIEWVYNLVLMIVSGLTF